LVEEFGVGVPVHTVGEDFYLVSFFLQFDCES